MSLTQPVILGLFPELDAIGGVQQVCRHLAWLLQEIATQTRRRALLLSLNDPVGPRDFVLCGRSVRYWGFNRRKLRLVAAALRGSRRAELVLLGHPHFAPLGWLASLRNRAPYWVVAHGIEVWHPLPGHIRYALQRSDGVIAVSRHTADQLTDVQGVRRERIAVIPPALDPDFATGSAEPPPLPRPAHPVLLTVGRMVRAEPGKGVDIVLEALERLLPRYPHLLYVVVGDGDARPGLECRVQERGLSHAVWFAGAQPLPQLRGFYQQADVFVMPSRQEGFGIVFLEAMSCGVPVIGARQGGIPDVIEDGVTGFLVEPNDVETLTACLDKVLQNPALREQMGAAARRAAERYRFEKFCARLRSLLALPAG